MRPARRALTAALALAAAVPGGALSLGLTSATADTVITVTHAGNGRDSAADGACRADAGTPGAGSCTLPAAIDEANRRSGADRIVFALPGTGATTVQLAPDQFLELTDDGTTIDGYSQAGARENRSARVFDGRILVEVRGGSGVRGADVLRVLSSGNTVRGLALYEGKRNVWIFGDQRFPGSETGGGTADGNRIVGNFIGTDATGTAGQTRGADGAYGVRVDGGARGNVVGSPAPADRNVISGNASTGVYLENAGTDENLVQGNLIGLAPDGARTLANDFGVDLNRGAAHNVVGGLGPGEGNVISGNRSEAIEVSHDPETTGNEVLGNLIGTDPTGTRGDGFANGTWAVVLGDQVTDTLVQGNTVVGSPDGLLLMEFGVEGTRVVDNRFGVTLDGTVVEIPGEGIAFSQGSTGNVVGPGNVVRGVGQRGVLFSDDADNSGNVVTRTLVSDTGLLAIDQPPLDVRGTSAPYPAAPRVTSASRSVVAGTACPGCRVEVYAAVVDGSGQLGTRQYLGSTTAGSDGAWEREGLVVPGGLVTATATTPGARATTSELAEPTTVRGGSRRVRYAP